MGKLVAGVVPQKQGAHVKVFATSTPAKPVRRAAPVKPEPALDAESKALLAVSNIKIVWLGSGWLATRPDGRWWKIGARDISFDKWRATVAAIMEAPG